MSPRLRRRASATALGLAVSALLPPLPDRLHPVARFGQMMGAVESRLWRDDRVAGVAYAATGVGVGAATATVFPSTTATVAWCAAGPQLRATAQIIADHLDHGDLAAARAALPALVGRDPSALDADGIAAAAIESVAENMVDAVFAPAWWALVGGARGAAIHRALNTMDAMVGRRNARYESFGWAAARADDVANFIPARLFVAAVMVVQPDRFRQIGRVVRRDAPDHPSPNAGVAEAAMAAALGRQVGGPLRYGAVEEDRPTLGDGPRPSVGDLHRALAVATRTEVLLVTVLGLIGLSHRFRPSDRLPPARS